MTSLALLGGQPAFPCGLAFARPAQPPFERVMRRLRPSYECGRLTNGELVRQLELQASARLGVPHVVAVASCTAGLMLTLQAVLPPGGQVLMPGFTFSATAHAAVWAGGVPMFADCRTDDYLLDVDDAHSRMASAAAVVATHVFGAPCHPEVVEAMAFRHGVPVVFDAAHAFGAMRKGWPIGGFGTAEVFSLSPTKLVVGGEGGLVATHDAGLAERVRIGRDYGNPGTYDTQFPGLNARMSELHAALALESLAELDEHLVVRRQLAEAYTVHLAAVPGVRTQRIARTDRSTFKDFTIVIDEDEFGLDRDGVIAALTAEGIDTRCYFSPPVHRQQAYSEGAHFDLPNTEWLSSRVISLPMWRDLSVEAVEQVADVIARVQQQADVLGAYRRSVCVRS
jgi:dTDP-4-amino-4,6-dideoxygalactose transaminase